MIAARTKRTARERRTARYRTKRYAMHEIRDLLRAHAKALRARKLSVNPDLDGTPYERASSHGAALAAMHALYRCGVITEAQLDRASDRLGRLSSAKVTRRPVALRSAA